MFVHLNFQTQTLTKGASYLYPSAQTDHARFTITSFVLAIVYALPLPHDMGNTFSAQRADFLQRDDRRFREIVQERNDRITPHIGEVGQDLGLHRRRPLTPRPQESDQQRNSFYSTLGGHTSVNSSGEQVETGHAVASEEIADEHEERPLMNMGDVNMRDVRMPDRAAGILSRQPSTMSRLGSRLLPESVARGLLNSGEETPAEGRALRLGNTVPERVRPTVFERRLPRQTNSRFSLRETLRTRSIARTGPRRQTIRGPFPVQHVNGQPIPQTPPEHHPSSSTVPFSADRHTNGSASWRRRARLSRVRDSLSIPLQSIFGPSLERSQSNQPPRTPPRRPSRAGLTDDSDHLLPPLPHADHRLELDDAPHELDAVEPETRNLLSVSSTRATQATSGIRRFPHALRSRSTRLIRRGEHPPLSQVLQLAAAAIAAQLSGHVNPSASATRPVGGEAFDGSIQNFVQTLQDVATAQAGESVEGDVTDGNLPPVNFLRVFQFPNTDVSGGDGDQDNSGIADPMDIDDRTEDGDHDRSVTLVLVGVRSMPSTGEGPGDENGNLGPSLDTLLNLPFLPPTNILRNGSSGALFRRSDGRSRLGTRRNSMTNFSSFPAQYESQRHQRTRSSAPRAPTDQMSLTPPVATTPTISSESPPGPHPPPSTPADPRSGTATPNRRPSSASAVQAPALPNLLENPSQAEAETINSSFTAARQRRRSDSEFARRPELSSGASRRNGVVEPDNPPVATGRSWLIYVVGTNVSPDHPAFTMPSLFTDNPSYEDMQLLSTLLGPVKPPVATQEDVTSAGGLFRIVERGGSLIAEALSPLEMPSMTLVGGDRCLICLCDYEAEDEVRQLTKCRHVYHRECVDEVSNFD